MNDDEKLAQLAEVYTRISKTQEKQWTVGQICTVMGAGLTIITAIVGITMYLSSIPQLQRELAEGKSERRALEQRVLEIERFIGYGGRPKNP